MSTVPATIGRYQVQRLLAAGGMGRVYLALDPVLQRQVAIKVLKEVDNDDLRERFSREARAAANLRHRNIVTVFDVDDHEGYPYMAMEYVQGQTLRAVIHSEPPPSTIRRLQIIESVCDGLAFAHARGIIHRDIKPANLMVGADGVLKILDFGIARAAADSAVTQAGHLVGSLNYMSPEQVAGAGIDSRSDMFAVGLVSYELFARREAFPGSDPSVLTRIQQHEPDPLDALCPGVDPDIPAIVHRALHKDPSRRFTDLIEMRDEVARVRQRLEAAVSLDLDRTSTLERSETAPPKARPSGEYREEITRRRTQQVEDHVAAARIALAAGNLEGAIARCEQALLLDPNDLRALDILDQASRLRDETRARAHLALAREELQRGNLTLAAGYARDALHLAPDLQDGIELSRIIGETRLSRDRERSRAVSIETLLTRARSALEGGDYARAMTACDEALAIDPVHADATRIRARAREATVVVPRPPEETSEAARAPTPRKTDNARTTSSGTYTPSAPLEAPGQVSPTPSASRRSRLWYAAAVALLATLAAAVVFVLNPSEGLDGSPVRLAVLPHRPVPLPQSPIVPPDIQPLPEPPAQPPPLVQPPETPTPPPVVVRPPAGPPVQPIAPPQEDPPSVVAGNDLPLVVPTVPVPQGPVENPTPPPGVVPSAPSLPTPPPVVTTTPVVPPALALPQGPSDREQVEAALEQYVQAVRNLDVAAVERIYPTVPSSQLRRDFEQAREYQLELLDREITVDGLSATVTTTMVTALSPRAGATQRSQRAMIFRLERRAEGWVIVDLVLSR